MFGSTTDATTQRYGCGHEEKGSVCCVYCDDTRNEKGRVCCWYCDETKKEKGRVCGLYDDGITKKKKKKNKHIKQR